MPVDPAEFRRLMGHLATGITVVASVSPEDGSPTGLTANAVASVSIRPPLILVCVDQESKSHDIIRAAGFFSVNILAVDQEALARRFSAWDMEDKFEDVPYRRESTGAPVLYGVLAWLDCRVHAIHPGGDHTIFVGEVEAGDARAGLPLLYFRGGYGRFSP